MFGHWLRNLFSFGMFSLSILSYLYSYIAFILIIDDIVFNHFYVVEVTNMLNSRFNLILILHYSVKAFMLI